MPADESNALRSSVLDITMNERTQYVLAMLALAAGFIILAIEVRYSHRLELAKHPIAWTPIVFSALASLMSLLSISRSQKVRQAAAFVFLLGIAVAGVGMMEHTKNNPVRSLRVLQPLGIEVPGANVDADLMKPPLAPLSMAGLGVLGAILVWPSKKR